jgi:ribosomal protein S3AE
MFGVERRVERVRQVLIQAFRAKMNEIMKKHAAKKPEEIPLVDLVRSMIFHDIAEILANLSIEKRPEDERES